jgi:opacity protein-like surface antigen
MAAGKTGCIGRSIMKRLVVCVLGLVAATESNAADLRLPVKATPQVQAVVLSWAGPYLGAHAGYLSAGGEMTFPGSAEFHLIDPKGFAGGALAGFNIQRGHLVAGIEGDFGYVGAKETIDTGLAPDPAATQMQSRITWNGHLRGRIGYATSQALFFIAGGLAVAGVENKAIDNTVGATASWNDTRAGWTLGGGVDFLAAPKVTVRLEYLYDNYGIKTLPAQSVGGMTFAEREHKLDTHTLRAGVTWRF